jgi:hypothetical protein
MGTNSKENVGLYYTILRHATLAYSLTCYAFSTWDEIFINFENSDTVVP